MAATLTSKSKMIQQTFDWESTADRLVGHDLASSEPAASLAVMETTSHATICHPATPPEPTTQRRRNSTTLTSSPTSSSKPMQRRNRCEHVGGVMATVLSKYGLGVDDLLHAIDNLRMARDRH
jgi:hypothetical protein